MVIGGLGLFLIVPIMPEMISSASAYYPNKITEITGISSGFFGLALNVGQTLGYIFGSICTKMTDFRICSDMVGLFIIIYATVYFIYGGGMDFIKSMYDDKIVNQHDKNE